MYQSIMILIVCVLIFFIILLEYLLAGKNADAKKISNAQRRHVEVINLRRLQKLLLGQLTFESIKQLERLAKESFKGDAYEPASSPPPEATAMTDESSN